MHGRKDNPKPICSRNFFEVGGIINASCRHCNNDVLEKKMGEYIRNFGVQKPILLAFPLKCVGTFITEGAFFRINTVRCRETIFGRILVTKQL